jgi:hypothetical protein
MKRKPQPFTKLIHFFGGRTDPNGLMQITFQCPDPVTGQVKVMAQHWCTPDELAEFAYHLTGWSQASMEMTQKLRQQSA